MRPQTQIEAEICKILIKYPKLSPFGDEERAMIEIANYIMDRVLKLEQVGLKGVDEWAIDIKNIEQLKKELFII